MLPRSIITTEAPEVLAVIAAANGTSRADDRQAVTHPMPPDLRIRRSPYIR